MGWWSMEELTMVFCLVDLRPGGAFLCRMRTPAGSDVWSGGIYREVVEGERLVFSAYLGGEDDAGSPVSSLVTVTFADAGDKTKVTLRETAETMQTGGSDPSKPRREHAGGIGQD